METADRFAVRLVEKHDGSEHTLFSGDGLGRHTADAPLAVILLAGVESELKPLVEDGPSHARENATVIGVERTADNPTAFTGWADKTPAEWGVSACAHRRRCEGLGWRCAWMLPLFSRDAAISVT